MAMADILIGITAAVVEEDALVVEFE
jgi:hypothetical protein